MTTSRFEKYLDNSADLEISLPQRRKTAAILTDSKGSYLHQHVTNTIENEIIWWCKPGRTSEEGINWLNNNIDSKLRRYGDLCIYLWLGTCDLTHKNGKYISLNESHHRDSAHIIRRFRELSILARQKQFKIVFLEIPYYSIKEWNRSKGHKNPDIFQEQDHSLQLALTVVNEEIVKLNEQNRTSAPKFNLDLLRNRKNKKRHVKYKYNFNLYKNEIHPNIILSKYWLRKISECVKRDCY